MKSCENCRYRKIDEDCLPCSACIDFGSDLSGWVGLTNADSIRAMTDEELAEKIAAQMACMECPLLKMCERADPRRCIDMWMSWLKSQVEVDE